MKKGKKISRETFERAGHEGGMTTLSIHGRDHFKKISKKGHKARWGNKGYKQSVNPFTP